MSRTTFGNQNPWTIFGPLSICGVYTYEFQVGRFSKYKIDTHRDRGAEGRLTPTTTATTTKYDAVMELALPSSRVYTMS